MGLEISQIQNRKLRRLANKIDKACHKDGTLDKNEFEIFKNEAQMKKVSNVDFKQAMGLYKSNENVQPVKLEEVTPNEAIDMLVSTETEYEEIANVIGKYEFENPKNRTTRNYESFLNELETLVNSNKISNATYERIKMSLGNNTIDHEINTILGIKDDSKAAEYRDARQSLLDNIEEDKDQKITPRQVKNGTKYFLEQEEKYDKEAKAIANKLSIENEVEAYRQTVEWHKFQTETQIKKEHKIKDKHGLNLNKLINAGLVVKTQDGTYDLTKLSNILYEGVGADYELTKTTKYDKVIAELTQTRRLANGALHDVLGRDITVDETKQLLKLCGYNIGKKDWLKVAGRALEGAAVGGALSAAGGYIVSMNKVKDNISVKQQFELAIKEGKLDLSKLPEGVKIVESATGIKIICNQAVKINEVMSLLQMFPNMVSKAAIPGAIAGALLGLLAGIKEEHPEIPVITTHLPKHVKTYEDFVRYYDVEVPQDDPEKKYGPVLKKLAEMFIVNGEFQVSEYEKFLNSEIAGTGGKINRKEFVGLLTKLEKGETKITAPETKPQSEAIPTYNTREVTNTTPGKTEKPAIIDNVTASRTTWANIANETYPDLVKNYGLSNAIRIIKLAQACEDPKLYEKENMEMLLNLSKMNSKALKDIKGFNYDVYYSKLTGKALVKAGDKDDVLYAPLKLAGVDRKVDPSAVTLQPNQKGNGRGTAPKRSVAGEYTTSGTSSTDYQNRFNGGAWNSHIEDQETRDREVDDFRKKYPNAKKEEIEQ